MLMRPIFFLFLALLFFYLLLFSFLFSYLWALCERKQQLFVRLIWFTFCIGAHNMRATMQFSFRKVNAADFGAGIVAIWRKLYMGMLFVSIFIFDSIHNTCYFIRFFLSFVDNEHLGRQICCRKCMQLDGNANANAFWLYRTHSFNRYGMPLHEPFLFHYYENYT